MCTESIETFISSLTPSVCCFYKFSYEIYTFSSMPARTEISCSSLNILRNIGEWSCSRKLSGVSIFRPFFLSLQLPGTRTRENLVLAPLRFFSTIHLCRTGGLDAHVHGIRGHCLCSGECCCCGTPIKTRYAG